MERALQGSAKDGALLFSAYITAIRLSVDVLLLQIFMRLSHDNIISAVFFFISEDTQMWLGQIFDFFQKSEMGGSIKDHTCKKHWSSHSKVFSLKTDTPCSRILRKWNKSANNMTIVSVQLSY